MTDDLDDAWRRRLARPPRSFGDRFLAPIVGLAADLLGWLDRQLGERPPPRHGLDSLDVPPPIIAGSLPDGSDCIAGQHGCACAAPTEWRGTR
jgi:hypothetical protein